MVAALEFLVWWSVGAVLSDAMVHSYSHPPQAGGTLRGSIPHWFVLDGKHQQQHRHGGARAVVVVVWAC